ncbi:MAG: choice-of-anchor Q domain-containing protein [Planctomycetota bacterium]
MMNQRSQRQRGARNRPSLHLEALEARRVLASFIVDSLGDTADAVPGDGIAADAMGQTTLRSAIEEANALPGADDISFVVNGNIPLTMGTQLSITDDLLIDGGNQISVDGNGTNRVFFLSDGDGQLNNLSVTIQSLTVTGGLATGGGGIWNEEQTELIDVLVTGNVIEQPNANYTGFGGGIRNAGNMVIRDSEISGNTARDPIGMPLGNTVGGGISNYQVDAVLLVEDSIVSNNESTDGGGGIHGQQNSVTIRGTTIANNRTGATGFFGGYGGGIAMLSNAYGVAQGPMDLLIESSTITGNTTDIGTEPGQGYSFPYGGGIYAGGQGQVTIRDSFITQNVTTGTVNGATPLARGGGAFFAGFSSTGQPAALEVDISGTEIDNNLAFAQGGAVAVRGRDTSAVNVTISESMIRGNSATRYQGGAFWTWGIGNTIVGQSNLMVEGSTISGNTANNGGGSFSWFGGYTRFEQTTFDNNYGISYGGNAIDNRGVSLQYGQLAGRAAVIDSTLSNNYGYGVGGAIRNYDGGLVVTQATISGNTGLNGGGLYLATYGPYVGTSYEYFAAVEASTLTENYGIAGGGLSVNDYAGFTVNNTIISNNTDTSAAPNFLDLGNPNSATAFSYSFIGDNTGSSLVPANPDASGNIIGDGLMPIDALLGSLANNGGPTLTHLPMAGSPVIDVGDPSVMGGADQRGFTRVVNGRVDMGAVETDATPATPDGDFNNDGFWNCLDIDALVAAIVSGGNDLAFDMNGDGMVTAADITDPVVGWLAVGGAQNPGATGGNPFLAGDANLDGVVDGQDFIVWNANKFTAIPAWCAGDFTADGVVDGQDFIVWNGNKFTSSDEAGRTAGGPVSREIGTGLRPKDQGAGGQWARPETRDQRPAAAVPSTDVNVGFALSPFTAQSASRDTASLDLPAVAPAAAGAAGGFSPQVTREVAERRDPTPAATPGEEETVDAEFAWFLQVADA